LAIFAVRSTNVDAGGAVSIAVTGAGGAAAGVAAVSVGVWVPLPAVSALAVGAGIAGTATRLSGLTTADVAVVSGVSTAAAPGASEVAATPVDDVKADVEVAWFAVSVAADTLGVAFATFAVLSPPAEALAAICPSEAATTVTAATVVAVSARTNEVAAATLAAVVWASGSAVATAEAGTASGVRVWAAVAV
jgi:hypothetical protein